MAGAREPRPHRTEHAQSFGDPWMLPSVEAPDIERRPYMCLDDRLTASASARHPTGPGEVQAVIGIWAAPVLASCLSEKASALAAACAARSGAAEVAGDITFGGTCLQPGAAGARSGSRPKSVSIRISTNRSAAAPSQPGGTSAPCRACLHDESRHLSDPLRSEAQEHVGSELACDRALRVLSRSVKHGMPRYVVSSCIPPESVSTPAASWTRLRNSTYPKGSSTRTPRDRNAVLDVPWRPPSVGGSGTDRHLRTDLVERGHRVGQERPSTSAGAVEGDDEIRLRLDPCRCAASRGRTIRVRIATRVSIMVFPTEWTRSDEIPSARRLSRASGEWMKSRSEI